jgi:Xaa-Pro dipeptidase
LTLTVNQGETSLPAGLQHAWKRGLAACEITRKTFKPGHTVKKTLKMIAEAMEEAGFVYTPFVDTPKDRDIVNALGKSKKSGYSIDCHCVGNTGNSEIAVGPSLAPFRKDRYHLKIQPNNLIAFEFIVHTWVPEWGRRHEKN